MKPERTAKQRRWNATAFRVISFFIILTLGTVGWLNSPTMPLAPAATGYNFFDALYRSLQLFVLNYDHPDASTWHPCLLLNVVRFVAPSFLVLALINRFSRRFQFSLVYLWNYGIWGGPQYLIIGYGRIGQGLAAAIKARAPRARVVAVDHRVTALNRQSAHFVGTELYEADAQDLDSFRNVPVRWRALDRVFVSVLNDQQTIATAANLAARIEDYDSSIWMQLNDWGLLDRLRNSSVLAERDSSPARKIRSFSMAEALGTQLVVRYRPALMAGQFGQNRLHAVLVRFDDFVWAMAEALILNGTTPPPRLARPRLTIIDARAQALAQQWWARHPHMHKWADISFEQADPTTLAWSAEAELLTRVEILDPPTLYIFGRSGDGDALSDALSLRHGMEKGMRQPAPVFLTTEVQDVQTFGLREIPENLQDRLYVIGGDAETAVYSHAVDPWFEKVALRFFKEYTFPGQEIDNEKVMASYEALPETMQVSNRRAAVHAVQILAWLGFEQVDAVAPHFGLKSEAGEALRTLFKAKTPSAPNEPSTYHKSWALYEHMRWCVDRAVDGWRQGLRDEEGRFRDQMERGRYDYEELLKKDKDLDFAQADGIANLLTEQRLLERGVEWLRHPFGIGKGFVRVEDGEAPLRLRWHFADGVLSLCLGDNEHWPEPPEAAGVHSRIRLLVPSEPALPDAKDPSKPMTPNERKRLRLAAYGALIAQLPQSHRLHFRFMRARLEGWEWLPKGIGGDAELAPSRIDGCTLPPLTVGFAGARNLEPFGGCAVVKGFIEQRIRTVLQEKSADGRPMRLITGVAKGADQIVIEIWRDWSGAEKYPIVALVPDKKRGQKIGKTAYGIKELLLLGEADNRAELNNATSASEAVREGEVFVEISERILNSCDVLIAVYDESEPEHAGGTVQTVRHAEVLGIEVVRILLAAKA